MRETAEIAVRASITGHLVFSTIHTNDAASTINRLVDMGIPHTWYPPPYRDYLPEIGAYHL